MGDSVINDSIVRCKWKDGKAIRLMLYRDCGYYTCQIPEHIISALNQHNSAGKNSIGTSWKPDQVYQLWMVGGSGTTLKTPGGVAGGSSYALLLGTANY